MYKMKRIDFENGTVTGNILGATLPMLVAQILNLSLTVSTSHESPKWELLHLEQWDSAFLSS